MGQGLVSSLSHPGGNITGFADFEVSLGTKWLEILKQIVPGVRRVTAIFNPETAPYYGLYLQSINAGTSLLGIESIPIQVHSEADIENAIRKVGSEPDSGLFVLPDSHNRRARWIFRSSSQRNSRLIINLTAAKALGLTIPPGVLSIADDLVE